MRRRVAYKLAKRWLAGERVNHSSMAAATRIVGRDSQQVATRGWRMAFALASHKAARGARLGEWSEAKVGVAWAAAMSWEVPAEPTP